jgi:hypothetical protein
MKDKERTGRFEDPDLVPVMNLICVLIPLMLWVTTWVAFGQVTAQRGRGVPPGPGPGEKEQKARLVAVLTQGSITLMADRGVADEVMPEDSTTGTKGRVTIPHRTLSLEDVRTARASCRPAADAADFDDCRYWAYIGQFMSICYDQPRGAVKVPDLKAFNLALRAIKDRLDTRLPSKLDDRHQLSFKSEDGVPYCQLIGLMDFSRLRRFEFDWNRDVEFRAGVDEALSSGVVDPLLAPESWNDAMRRELLFPIVSFVE